MLCHMRHVSSIAWLKVVFKMNDFTDTNHLGFLNLWARGDQFQILRAATPNWSDDLILWEIKHVFFALMGQPTTTARAHFRSHQIDRVAKIISLATQYYGVAQAETDSFVNLDHCMSMKLVDGLMPMN